MAARSYAGRYLVSARSRSKSTCDQPERDGDLAATRVLGCYARVRGGRAWLSVEQAFAGCAYAFERAASAKVTIRPRTSSHSAWRDACNPSARVSTDTTAKHGWATW